MNQTSKAKLGDIVDEGRFKDLTVEAGCALRDIRLKGFPDPDKNLKDLHIYELWKRIVEVYSRTQLTVSRDKLIALAGVARLFDEEHLHKNTKRDYVVGLWSSNLESQLLWQVNELYQGGVFENPARRDVTRAPSFSWASVDTPYGITYGEDDPDPTTKELFFKVEDYHIIPLDTKNPFGMVKGGQLLLKPDYLRPIKLNRLEPPLRVPYSWCLTETTLDKGPIEHVNLYLDAPDSDVDIFKHDAELYCMAAAFGERTVRKESRYLYCLLLKYEDRADFPKSTGNNGPKNVRAFRRIGITKLSNHIDEDGQKDLMAEKTDELIVLQ
ncbi:hypothetical protein GQ44DRAFT_601548 [Phaeosphaeriaceae sp. PMI808]|nr:hypothetical protein GQ44DRAFT_601548 [Phaeosphaeriaceae sp. PMI808]